MSYSNRLSTCFCSLRSFHFSIEMILLHQAHPVPVHKSFRESYFANDMEEKVFKFLNKVSSKDPFCDVTFTGHSFGGALACIAALRFATFYPMMTVSCHVFGTPRVGGLPFRLLANSLPNLKIVRLENGSDPYVRVPEGVKWVHAGHTIIIVEENLIGQLNSNFSEAGPFTPGSATNRPVTYKALAYRFDERRPIKTFSWSGVSGKKTKAMKRDHEIRSYVNSILSFTYPGRPWVASFVGEEGRGISGMDDEVRCVV